MILCLTVCLSVYLSICLSACLSTCLSVCLSACLSVCLSVYLSPCLSACVSLSVSTTDLSAGWDSGFSYLRRSPDQYSSRESLDSLDPLPPPQSQAAPRDRPLDPHDHREHQPVPTHPSTRSQPSFCSSIHPHINMFFYLFILSFIHLPIHSLFQLLIHLSIN